MSLRSLVQRPGAPRLLAAAAALLLTLVCFLAREPLGGRGRAILGILVFLAATVALSRDPRAIRLRTVVGGLATQLLLAVLVLRTAPGAAVIGAIAAVVEKFLSFSDAGARFVFGHLASPETMSEVFGPERAFIFAVRALPTIIFVSSVFTCLYHLGVLQWIVRRMAWVMVRLMATSGAESLSAAANVFMGQTEAPLIVRPYVPTMTRSELLAMMTGGFATISGGIMAVYMQMGADAQALLTGSVMAAPCSLMLAKILYPEDGEPVTAGIVRLEVTREDRNVVDAAARGASEGLKLALNVAAVLIAFLAIIALLNYVLSVVRFGPAASCSTPGSVGLGSSLFLAWPGGPAPGEGCTPLSLSWIFSRLFSPVAMLIGAELQDVPAVADLLGTKLVANEFVAYADLTGRYRDVIAPSSFAIATFALCGFANFGSVGIQLGGIGAMAPTRRGDLAQLGMRALYCGFVATLLNAAVAGMLLS